MKSGFLPLAVGALVLAGCVENMPHPDRPRPLMCNADRAQYAIGKLAKPGLINGARRAARAASVRVVRPGEAVTMDYRADRLNIETDNRNLVRSVRCG